MPQAVRQLLPCRLIDMATLHADKALRRWHSSTDYLLLRENRPTFAIGCGFIRPMQRICGIVQRNEK